MKMVCYLKELGKQFESLMCWLNGRGLREQTMRRFQNHSKASTKTLIKLMKLSTRLNKNWMITSRQLFQSSKIVEYASVIPRIGMKLRSLKSMSKETKSLKSLSWYQQDRATNVSTHPRLNKWLKIWKQLKIGLKMPYHHSWLQSLPISTRRRQCGSRSCKY